MDFVNETRLYPPGHPMQYFYSRDATVLGGEALLLADVRHPQFKDPIKGAVGREDVSGATREGDVRISGVPFVLRQIPAPDWWDRAEAKA